MVEASLDPGRAALSSSTESSSSSPFKVSTLTSISVTVGGKVVRKGEGSIQDFLLGRREERQGRGRGGGGRAGDGQGGKGSCVHFTHAGPFFLYS